MLFSEFSHILTAIEATTLRNQMTVELAGLFKKLGEGEIEAACWLLLGRVYPSYEGIEFQFAEKMMEKAIATACGVDLSVVQSKYKKAGDMGEVAMEFSISNSQFSVNDQEIKSQTIILVFSKLRDLAGSVGSGSQERKLEIVVSLLKSLDPLSVKYVVRIILGKLRLGFSDMTILDALSWAVKGDKSDRKVLEDAYQNKHDIGKLAVAYLSRSADQGISRLESADEAFLKNFSVELGIPIQPALCQRLKTPQEMIEKMGKVFVEPKYDGTRVQIHIRNLKSQNSKLKIDENSVWKVRTFTRSLEESSAQFPELTDAITAFGDHDLILDCEAVGYDPKTGKLLPFQETIQRKRKHDIEAVSKRIPLRFFVFDVLFLDGKSLLNTPLSHRKEHLQALFKTVKDHELGHMFIESPFIVTDGAGELRSYHKKQLDAGLEGAVIKKYDSPYQPGRRGWSWVKFKEEETSEGKLSDTIDAVVMGYWYGKGKRTGFGIGAFLIGVLGPEEKILTLTKVGTGLSDEQWKELKDRCAKGISVEKPPMYEVDKLLVPDVWVEPSTIVEVAGDELTKSPTHTAGLALRFPRLVRFRDDKAIDQITTKKELSSIK